MSVLLDHLAAVAPPGQLVGTAVRFLREPSHDGADYRGLGMFRWMPATKLPQLVEVWPNWIDGEIAEQWLWIHDVCGGPARCARHRYLHGERIPGALMLRPVTCARRPANGGGKLDELTAVLGLPVDLDVAQRRPEDRRRYCPTIDAGLELLGRFAPTVILDAGGGLVAVWLFTGPAEPHAARQLGRDLVAAIDRAAHVEGWKFDSPPAHSAWVKAPGCVDLFRRHITTEVAAGEPWAFADLRDAVPPTRRAGGRPWHHYTGVDR